MYNFLFLKLKMNKHDKLLVIDPKLLISGGSSIHSNDFNPDEDNL
jgi:phosphatidylserine/phosphatidylglycerophosphate/cardiolipin synthase-like enzyme